jgi:hypothetical protein
VNLPLQPIIWVDYLFTVLGHARTLTTFLLYLGKLPIGYPYSRFFLMGRIVSNPSIYSGRLLSYSQLGLPRTSTLAYLAGKSTKVAGSVQLTSFY